MADCSTKMAEPLADLMKQMVMEVVKGKASGTLGELEIAIREATQAVRGQEVARTGVYHVPLLIACQRAVLQGNSQKLIGAQARIITSRSVDDIKTVSGRGVPEPGKAGCGVLGQVLVAIRGLMEELGKLGHDAHRMVPQCVDLHRLADPGRHHPAIHLGVHPGQLDSLLAGKQQSIP